MRAAVGASTSVFQLQVYGEVRLVGQKIHRPTNIGSSVLNNCTLACDTGLIDGKS